MKGNNFMKLNGKIFIRKIGNEHFAMLIEGLGKDSNKMIRCNDTSAFLFEKLEKETNLDELADALTEKYEIDRETAYEDAKDVVDSLRKAGFIRE